MTARSGVVAIALFAATRMILSRRIGMFAAMGMMSAAMRMIFISKIGMFIIMKMINVEMGMIFG